MSAPVKAESVPVGWKLVPEEPTPDMLLKGCQAGLSLDALLDDGRFACERRQYAAMLAAAPAPPVADPVRGVYEDDDHDDRLIIATPDEAKKTIREAMGLISARLSLATMAISNAVDTLANRGRFGSPDDALTSLKSALDALKSGEPIKSSSPSCENCGEPVDDQSPSVREHLAETGEVFCDACVEESRDAAEAYAAEDGEPE